MSKFVGARGAALSSSWVLCLVLACSDGSSPGKQPGGAAGHAASAGRAGSSAGEAGEGGAPSGSGGSSGVGGEPDDGGAGNAESSLETFALPKQFIDEDDLASLALSGFDAKAPGSRNRLSVEVVELPEQGELEVTRGQNPLGTNYRPRPDFFGTDELAFVVTDSAGRRSPRRRVKIEVRPVNDAPRAVDDRTSTNFLNDVEIDVTENDIDVEGDALIVTSVTQPSSGTVEIVAGKDGMVRFTPRHLDSGLARFEYTVADASGAEDTGTVEIDVGDTDVVRIESFTAEPREIVAGASTTLSWISEAAERCTLDGGGETGGRTSGTVQVRPEASIRYELTCEGPGGRVSDYAEVIVVRSDAPDDDGDGLPNDVEELTGTDAADADFDDDGVPDGAEDGNANGAVDAGETDPRTPDSDDDGFCDGLRADNDGDGVAPVSSCVGPLLVDAGGGADWPDGLSWATAFRDPQEAVDAAVPGRDVWVRQGRYRAKAPVTPVLVLRDGIEVYGGFAGGETYRAARDVLSRATVLDGDFEGDDADVPAVDANFPEGNPAARRADNSDHVVYGAEGARLDGFRIEHGHAGSGTFEGGGGLLALSPNLTLSHVDFVENSSTGLGGAILCAEYCDLTVEAARFSANRAANGGGLLAWPKSSLGPRFVDLTNVEFSDNWALEAGGGLYLRNNDPTAIRGLTCLRNEVDVYFGGCLYSQDTRVSVDDSEIAHNRAVRGAGAYGWRSTLSLTNSEINDNVASYLGGGFVSEGSDARIVGCRFVNDRATYGGAIALHATTRFELEHSEIVDNVAEIGAGLYSDLSGVRLYGVRMSGGQARDGGAMAIFSSSMTVSNGSFVANTAEEMGGAVYLTGATLEFRSGAFLRNHARFGGGIFAHPNVGYEVVDVVLAGNTAEWSGAGIYQAASVDGTLSRALFAGNNANHGIGLMMLGPGSLRGERLAFVANRGMNGGGLLVDALNEPGCDVSLREATFARNSANEAGAGFFAVNSAAATLANATFSENVTFGSGGAIETHDADLLAINVAFWANRARSGSAVANRTARGTRLVHASFLDNDADEGVVYNEGSSSSVLRNSVFFSAGASQSELVDLGVPSVAGFVAARHLLPGTGNAVLAADPFELAPGARLFLNQALVSPPTALDAGSNAIAEDAESGFTALAETSWTELTTAADGRFDAGTVDLGRHYAPAAATILSFEALSTSFAWSTANVDSCFLFNVAEESIASLAPNELASGTRWHTSSSATEFALICFGPVGEPTVAFATVP